MIWGIIAAVDAELAPITAAMELEGQKTIFGARFYIGRIGESRVAAACCSIGTINAAVCASVLIREFGASAVVNIGVAGSACQELRVLDVVLSDEVLFHDVDTGIIKQYYPFLDRFPADEGLLSLAEESIAGMEGRSFRHKVGRVATGDVFVDDPARKLDIKSRLNPLCVEMEGAAVGQTAYMSGVPFLVIRSISDDAGEGAFESFDSFLEQAAQNSAEIVLGMIRLAAGGDR